jgi:HK97 family phage major capsid protein
MSKFNQYLQEALDIRQRSEDEGRDMTPEEFAQHGVLIDKAKHARVQNDTRQAMKSLSGGEIEEIRTEGFGGTGRLGDFVNMREYAAIKNSAGRGQTWSSGAVEISTKGTLFEGSVAGTLTPAQYEAGIVSKLFQPTGLADFFGQQQTTASHVRYVVEGTATSGAAGVAEGGAKPESTLNYSEVDEKVKKIATSLPVSDELLEDSVSFQSYLNTRLTSFLATEEERQLLLGGGTDELTGIIGRSGVNTLGTAAAGTIVAEHILKAATGSRGSAFLDPDLIVMNPTNWQTLRLGKDSSGQYYGGGPFQGAYGGPNASVSAGYFSAAPIWGMNCWVTNQIGSGTALLGNFRQAAAIFRRGGPTVEASNSHSDFFTKNLNMVRAEERLALAVFRPASFVVLSF